MASLSKAYPARSERLCGLTEFIAYHNVLMKKCIVPIAKARYERAERIIAAAVQAEKKPKMVANEGAGLNQFFKVTAEKLFNWSKEQTGDLEAFASKM